MEHEDRRAAFQTLNIEPGTSSPKEKESLAKTAKVAKQKDTGEENGFFNLIPVFVNFVSFAVNSPSGQGEGSAATTCRHEFTRIGWNTKAAEPLSKR